MRRSPCNLLLAVLNNDLGPRSWIVRVPTVSTRAATLPTRPTHRRGNLMVDGDYVASAELSALHAPALGPPSWCRHQQAKAGHLLGTSTWSTPGLQVDQGLGGILEGLQVLVVRRR